MHRLYTLLITLIQLPKLLMHGFPRVNRNRILKLDIHVYPTLIIDHVVNKNLC